MRWRKSVEHFQVLREEEHNQSVRVIIDMPGVAIQKTPPTNWWKSVTTLWNMRAKD